MLLRHRFASSRSLFAAAALAGLVFPLAAGCSSAAEPELGHQESADEIAPFDDPSGLLGRVSRRLADNISLADVGQTFGVPDERVPYPDNYWPMYQNGIDVVWNGDQASPLEKYMTFADTANLQAARAWNKKNQGVDVPNVQSWFGICHGWAGAAAFERPVVRPVTAKVEGGRVRACAEGEEGCTRFEIGDVNALLAQIYTDADSRFIGARCDTAASDIVRDDVGRIDRTANGRGCKGLNPGALLIAMSHRIKRDQKPFVINAQSDYNTDEIWNQPAYRYTVNRFEALSPAEATNLVATGRREGEGAAYRWNDKARGFAFLDVTLHWVTEHGPNTTYVSGLESTRTTRMVAVIELDRDIRGGADGGAADAGDAGSAATIDEAAFARANILGGEYLEDDSADATRLRVPPFVWIVVGPGPERPNPWRGHNPYVKTSIVRQLAALGQ